MKLKKLRFYTNSNQYNVVYDNKCLLDAMKEKIKEGLCVYDAFDNKKVIGKVIDIKDKKDFIEITYEMTNVSTSKFGNIASVVGGLRLNEHIKKDIK